MYVGVRDVAPVEGLREILRGQAPTGRASRVEVKRLGASALNAAVSAGQRSGSIVKVAGTRIEVDSSIASNVAQLVKAARGAGIALDGSGWRSSLRQAQLRIANGCTCSDSSKCCNPPTAPVGKSQHEVGLAIDFTVNGQTVKSNTAAYRWLVENAGRYGLRNLPGEPWHWSTTGR
jgi:LAS superfamily LD-carboxypeptidase LdcB